MRARSPLLLEDEILGTFGHPHRLPFHLYNRVEVGEVPAGEDEYLLLPRTEPFPKTRDLSSPSEVLDKTPEQLRKDNLVLVSQFFCSSASNLMESPSGE